MDVIVIEATNTNNKEDKNEQQQPSPKSFEQSNYTFNDESLLNLINVNANKYKTSNLTTSQENDESLDHLNDLYLKEFLLKLITHLDMSHLKLTKTQTQNNINNKQRQQINSDVFIKVSVKSVKGAISYDTFIKVIAVRTVRYYRARSYESIIFPIKF